MSDVKESQSVLSENCVLWSERRQGQTSRRCRCSLVSPRHLFSRGMWMVPSERATTPHRQFVTNCSCPYWGAENTRRLLFASAPSHSIAHQHLSPNLLHFLLV